MFSKLKVFFSDIRSSVNFRNSNESSNSGTILSFFLRNNVGFLIVIIGSLFISSFITYLYYQQTFYFIDLDFDRIHNSVMEGDFSELLEDQTIEEDTEILIVDKNLKIIKSINSKYLIGTNFENEEFNTYGLYDENKHVDSYLYYLSNYDHFIIMKYTYYPIYSYIDVSAIYIISYIVEVLIGMYFYVRSIKKKIVFPLKDAIGGISKIAKGEYDYHFDVYENNEIGELKLNIDILRRKTNQSELSRLKSEKNKGNLLLDISHDLQTPLTNIIGYSQTLMNEKLDKKQYEFARIINHNGQRASKMIMDLFEISKLESHDLYLQFGEYDICEFSREILIEAYDNIDMDNQSIEAIIPDENLVTLIDREVFYRAIDNIISNFSKYAGDNATLTYEVKKLDDLVAIDIKDDGIGVPSEVIEKIYEPFYRVDSHRRTDVGGTGLGLSITKKIVELHGGSVSFKSDKGLEIRILLPLAI